MKSRFYKGFPLLTYEMNSMAPSLKTIHAILKVQQLGRTINSYGVNTSENATRLARQMVEQPSLTQITLNDNSEWLIVSKPTIVWKNSGNGMLVQQNPGAYSGVVQIAHLGDKPAENINVLQKYAGNYPIEASITYAKAENKQNVGRSSDVVFFYKTNAGNGGDMSRFLMLEKSQEPSLCCRWCCPTTWICSQRSLAIAWSLRVPQRKGPADSGCWQYYLVQPATADSLV
ncbi:hypothetical protein BX661DRAFT_97751 [Kickxella alabastrina]|uniref:uncharacterized protein n=1 Tax=Kickxella alabastrina TaxID=61397 RepID=UPI00221F173F|nr:uncharacterized protein BX661DRAFT_97751 [Kickxella alabastrina]KAI7830156.1 hypothetical protein BX661DRAFT_97751 [Kickxella alabastrina]